MSTLKITHGAELAQHILTGEAITSEVLDQLVKNKVREDLHLDYKHGKLLENTDAAQELRRHVSGFANAEGGVLIIGIGEEEDSDNKGRLSGRPSSVTGCQPPRMRKVRDLDSWAHDVLAELRPTTVVILVVEHDNGPVLLIAVARSLRLVPCSEKSSIVHYLRVGDGTHRMDSYLYADLVLGRRQEPDLEFYDWDLVGHPSFELAPYFEVQWRIRLENSGLVWVADWRGAIVGYSAFASSASWGVPKRPSASIRRQVDTWSDGLAKRADVEVAILEPGSHWNGPIPAPYGQLPPMGAIDLFFHPLQLPLPPSGKRGRLTWEGGLYMVPSNGRPIWVQLAARFMVVRDDDGRHDVRGVKVECRKLSESERPRVSFAYTVESM